MTDFLARLVQRSLGLTSTVRPSMPSQFAAGPNLAEVGATAHDVVVDAGRPAPVSSYQPSLYRPSGDQGPDSARPLSAGITAEAATGDGPGRTERVGAGQPEPSNPARPGAAPAAETAVDHGTRDAVGTGMPTTMPWSRPAPDPVELSIPSRRPAQPGPVDPPSPVIAAPPGPGVDSARSDAPRHRSGSAPGRDRGLEAPGQPVPQRPAAIDTTTVEPTSSATHAADSAVVRQHSAPAPSRRVPARQPASASLPQDIEPAAAPPDLPSAAIVTPGRQSPRRADASPPVEPSVPWPPEAASDADSAQHQNPAPARRPRQDAALPTPVQPVLPAEPARSRAPSSTEAASAGPDGAASAIQVTIGRIEVRADTSRPLPPPRPAPQRRRPAVSLDQYLGGRNRGRS